MNLLVVDDNLILNRFLTTYFGDQGHTVSSLTDSTKVEGWLELYPCDGVILSITMPKLDSFTLLKKLREKYDRNRLVVFFTTGLGENDTAMMAADTHDANGYLTKCQSMPDFYAAFMRAFKSRDLAFTA